VLTNGKVVVYEESIDLRSHRPITGKIHFQFGEAKFPEVDWSDFVVVVLSWWLKEFKEFAKGEVDQCDFRFMDGPHSVRLMRLSSALARVLFINHTESEEILEVCSSEIASIGRSLLSEAEKVTSLLRSNGIWNEDAQDLDVALNDLEILMAAS